MDGFRKLHGNGIDTGGGQTEQHILLGDGVLGQNLCCQPGLLFQAAAFGTALVEHHRGMEDGGDAGKAAGPIEGFLRQHVGVAAAEDIDQTVGGKNIPDHSGGLQDFFFLVLADAVNGGFGDLGVLIEKHGDCSSW